MLQWSPTYIPFSTTLLETDTTMRFTPNMSHAAAFCHVIATFVFFLMQGSVSSGQTQIEPEIAQQNRIRLENKIDGETVQRTSGIRSVSTVTSNLDTRLSQIERMLLTTNLYTGISAKEARAALSLAMAKRNELLKRPSKPSEVENATAELSVARAESQLAITLATQRERMLVCQIDVSEAELKLLQMRKKIEMQQRLLARGLSPSDTFIEQKLAMSAAEKTLELMRVRLETQRILQGLPDAKPDADPKPPSRSSTTP